MAFGPADNFEGPRGQRFADTATPLGFDPTDGMARRSRLKAILDRLRIADYFRFDAPAGANAMDLQRATSGISLLTPQMSILDAAGTELASAESDDPLNNNRRSRSITFNQAQTYYVEVAAHGATSSASAATIEHRTRGGDSGPSAAANSGEENAAAATRQRSVSLATTPGYVEHTYYEMDDSLSECRAAAYVSDSLGRHRAGHDQRHDGRRRIRKPLREVFGGDFRRSGPSARRQDDRRFRRRFGGPGARGAFGPGLLRG